MGWCPVGRKPGHRLEKRSNSNPFVHRVENRGIKDVPGYFNSVGLSPQAYYITETKYSHISREETHALSI
jgi:hypothetical protein